MKLWFVSRETLEEAKSSRDRMIERLEREILELKEDRKVTVDILSVRALGMSVYGKIVPPKEEEMEPEPETKHGEDGEPKSTIQMGGRARGIAQAVGNANLERHAKEQTHLMDLIAQIDQAKEEGRAAAVPTNGNGDHS